MLISQLPDIAQKSFCTPDGAVDLSFQMNLLACLSKGNVLKLILFAEIQRDLSIHWVAHNQQHFTSKFDKPQEIFQIISASLNNFLQLGC